MKARPSGVLQPTAFPSSVIYFFPPLFVAELLITSLSPLHSCIPHNFVILPRKRIRELCLSASTLFLCFIRPFSAFVHSQFGLLLHPPHPPSHEGIRQEQWLLGSDLRSNGLCPASNSACYKLFIFAFEESASPVQRKCLLFQEVCPAF